MNISLDVHGVIDKYPTIFRRLSHKWDKEGHTIHIVTGQRKTKIETEVQKFGIVYHKFFSILDFHSDIGTPIGIDAKGGECIDSKLWERSKGDYIHKAKIDIHFDDTLAFAKWIPKTCIYVLVPKENFEIVFSEIFLDFLKSL